MSGTSSTARVAWVCAVALTIFVVWISTDVGASAGIGFFYAVPVGLATWWWGARAGAVAGAGCTVLYVTGTLIHPIPDFGSALAVRLAAFVGAVVLVSLARERLIVLEHSVEELDAIRAALAPASLPDLADVDAAAAFAPSEYGVSGDFYLLTNGPDGSTVAIVGDVVGHGPDAARLATFIRARFAAYAANTSNPAELLGLANGALMERSARQRKLVSAVCLRFDARDAQLSWAVAGHPLPLRLPGLDELATADATFLLGAKAHLSLSNRETSLREDSGVFVYTDGATDVRREGALLGRDGLVQLLAPLAGLSAKAMASQAENAILSWTDEPIRDDLCVLVLKPRGPGGYRPASQMA